LDAELITSLKEVVGKAGYLDGDDVGEKYYSDPRGVGDNQPNLILRPATTEELSKIMKLCFAAGQGVVAQGGMTGLVTGARPEDSEIPISFERMNGIDELDGRTSTMTVKSGTPLQVIQEHADGQGFLFPLDLGARGSCTIGGNLSTNAGGNRVIRYGMTRDLVLGVEAVLADGTIISSLNKMIKNNTGYDLKQLFIGSEGTLGLITKVVLRLSPKPRSQSVAFCGAMDFDSVVNFMQHMKSGLGGNLSAFEVIWRSTYNLIVDKVETIKAPLSGDYGYYVLVETMGGDAARDQDRFEDILGEALEADLIEDAVISKSQGEIDDLWQVRDGMAEAMATQQPASGFDVSLLIGDMEYFCAEVDRRLKAAWPEASVHVGGHLGDGNLHLVAKAENVEPQPKDAIDTIVYDLVGELGGSVSAEHGIGIAKKAYLTKSRNPAELALMHTLKQSMDPKGLLNRGRVFEMNSPA
jgi:FAD/FMN-containing dehydrogenase